MSIVAVANTYLDALISRDARGVPFADHVRRINNGTVTAEGADELRALVRREPPLKTHGLRWLVDGDHAVTFYDLDAEMGGDAPIPAYIGERFTVRDGLIEEIEVVYTARPGEPRPARPERHPPKPGVGDETLAAARRYVAALVSHHAGEVPVAADVWRVENGQVTADGGADLERQAAHAVPLARPPAAPPRPQRARRARDVEEARDPAPAALPVVPLVAPAGGPGGTGGFAYPPTVEIAHGYRIGEHRLVLPRNPAELTRSGRRLSNCLADYAGAVRNGRSVVIGLEERGTLVAALELRDGAIRQFVGVANGRPTRARRDVVNRMLRDLALGGR